MHQVNVSSTFIANAVVNPLEWSGVNYYYDCLCFLKKNCKMPLLHTALLYSQKKKKTLNNTTKSKATKLKRSHKAEKKYYCTLHKNISHFIKLYRFVKCLIVSSLPTTFVSYFIKLPLLIWHTVASTMLGSGNQSAETPVIYLF